MGYRVDVGGIQIEPIASHLDIIRIRRLENNQSAVAKHSKSLLEKLDKHFERQMLEDMEAGDSSKGTIRQRVEHGKRIGLFSVQSQFVTGGDHVCLRVRSSRDMAVLSQQFQPFPPSAAKVQNGFVRSTDAGCRQIRQVNAHSFLDVRTAAAELVLKSQVEGIPLRRRTFRHQVVGEVNQLALECANLLLSGVTLHLRLLQGAV